MAVLHRRVCTRLEWRMLRIAWTILQTTLSSLKLRIFAVKSYLQ